jgi:hypothetical protein
MPDKARFYVECARVLRPGGVFLGNDWLQRDGLTASEAARHIEPICRTFAVPHMVTLTELERYLADAGLRVEVIEDVSVRGNIDRNWELVDAKNMDGVRSFVPTLVMTTIKVLHNIAPGLLPPVLRILTDGGVALTEAARAGAFLIGHWRARKPAGRLTTSLHRAVAHLLSLQGERGDWEGEMVWCPMITAQYVIVRCVVGRPLDAAARAAIIRHFERTRTSEGAWGLHPESPGFVFVTALGYVALRLLGVAPEARLTAAARHWLRAQPGGVPAIPTWGKFWLALIGLYDYRGLNACPPELFLAPAWLPVHPRRYYCHTRVDLSGDGLPLRAARPRRARSDHRGAAPRAVRGAVRAHRLRRASRFRRADRPLHPCRAPSCGWRSPRSMPTSASILGGAAGAPSITASPAFSSSKRRAGTRGCPR